MLDRSEQQTLLRLARRTLEVVVGRGGRVREVELSDLDLTPSLRENRGAFVTLTTRATDDLRGCIGYIEGREPLYLAVMDNARNAALSDPRFPHVRPKEVPALHLEISALGPLEPCPDPSKIEIGVHGLVVECGERRGLLLPQVPVEWGWDRETFLRQTCKKAGVAENAWRSPDAQLYWFAAQVFGEER